jgi:hypothetical protein
VCLEQRVHRNHRCSRDQRPVEEDGKGQDVGQHHAHPVTGHDAASLQPGGNPPRCVDELLVAQDRVTHPQRGAATVLGCRVEQVLGQVPHGDLPSEVQDGVGQDGN